MSKNPFPFSRDNKRYQTYSYYLSQRFGGRVARISLNAGMTCPNLDGVKGVGGCIYCAPTGGGEFGGNPQTSITSQFMAGVVQMRQKWKTEKFIAYFQAHTNTYAPVETLRSLYEEALSCPGVIGLVIATRPDCLSQNVCDLLWQLSQRTYLTVELGLQTVHDSTGDRINRCHTYEEFLTGYNRLHTLGVNIGVHLINGLPGETPEMMRKSAEMLSMLELHLVKIHMLHLLQGTPLAQAYETAPFPLLSQEEYVGILCDQLELLPPNVVIARVTGDGAAADLIAPHWTRGKRGVLCAIDRELAARDSWQGKRCPARQ